MKYIDLTHVLDESTSVSPFDKKIHLEQVKFLEKDYYNDSLITTTMHIGTHIDAPSHMVDSDIKISDIPIHQFMGEGVLLDFEDEKKITLRDKDKNRIKENSIIVIYTNMDKKFGSDEYYYDHPKLTMGLAKYLVEKKVKIVALDFYSPDSLPLEIHKILLSNNILIAENLKDVHLLKDTEFELYLVPIKINAEGAFIRAFAKIK